MKSVVMKSLALFVIAAPLFAGNLENFTDSSLNATQRNTACLAMRGDKSEGTVAALQAALTNINLQACAAANLRIAGAEAVLADALSNQEPSTRAVAARELGVVHKPEYLSALRKAADDPDLLVASNALEGLLRYEDHSSAPQLREIAVMGGVMTTLAVNALADWRDPEVLPIARKLLSHRDPGDQLAGIRVVGLMGDPSDLPSLRELMKNDEKMGQGSRGFGLMPAISIARAARTAAENITQRFKADL
jgi:HEAT repeat protein